MVSPSILFGFFNYFFQQFHHFHNFITSKKYLNLDRYVSKCFVLLNKTFFLCKQVYRKKKRRLNQYRDFLYLHPSGINGWENEHQKHECKWNFNHNTQTYNVYWNGRFISLPKHSTSIKSKISQLLCRADLSETILRVFYNNFMLHQKYSNRKTKWKSLRGGSIKKYMLLFFIYKVRNT